MATAINESYWIDKRLRDEAEGYQFNTDGSSRMIADPNPNAAMRNPLGLFDRNGGLVISRRVELAEDNLMFRFAAKKYLGGDPATLKTLLNSPWWMEEDRMRLLLDRARTAGAGLIQMARNQLALPVEWTDCDIIVSARIKPGVLLAAHAGPGRTVSVASGRYTIPGREAPHLHIDQIYLPGLGPQGGNRAKGMANAEAWFDLATLRSYDPAARGFNP
ncbi:hypothetical protein [Plastoroseomonas arctica]|uniref:Uncharacterized protein n=1 Tax=Plastoroseomonas arctica TaxID=1509237 RepID=A0AAF1KPD1_9PROT|nr:hypothetical protein [Plastoroseomonas arctica]MBR0657344.1 hypothetical protein [Plastoroseomonas arctica]